MQIKRYTAKNMTDAMALVKKELGDDAVILASRRLESDSGSDLMEITAATDNPLDSVNDIHTAKIKVTRSFDKIPEDFPAIEQDASNLQKLLDKHGILPNLSKKIDNAVKAMSNTGFDDLDTLDMLLSKMIPFEAPAKTISKGKVHIFIGPTGAGKSTTVCKLATQKKLDGHNIALTSLDNHKIGAYEQISIYANALGEQALLIKNTEDWGKIKPQLQERDFIFMDTPGVNVFNTNQVAELKKRIDSLKLADIAVHLVLPASLNPLEMAAMPAAVAALHPESILFTKFDETTYLGGLTNVAVTSGLKICYVTDGTSVLDDIVELDASMLAEKLMRKPRLPWEREA